MVTERVSAASAELVAALKHLIPQLTGNNPPPSAAELALLLQNDENALVVARHPDKKGPIVGAGALGVYRVPTGVRAVIEDIVVDSSVRGLGIGEAITRELMELARQAGARSVSLTSNPGRQAANRLYLRLGFMLRQTNCYYFEFR
jgi:ribosomal protein S18 acetylase RimI-like enzyme